MSLQPYQVSISVRSVEESAAWYQNMLGFCLSKRVDFSDYGVRVALLEKDGFKLELIEKQGSLSIRSKFPELQDATLLQGFKKLAFRIANLEQTVFVLKQQHVKFVFDITQEHGSAEARAKWCIVEDPDGNWLQLFGQLL